MSESRVSQDETVTPDPRVVKEGEVYVDRPVPPDLWAQQAFRGHKGREEKPVSLEILDSMGYLERQVLRERTGKPVSPAPRVQTVSQEFQGRGVNPEFKESLDRPDRGVPPENEERPAPQENPDHRDHKDRLESEETREVRVSWDCQEIWDRQGQEGHVETGVLGVCQEKTESLVKVV